MKFILVLSLLFLIAGEAAAQSQESFGFQRKEYFSGDKGGQYSFIKLPPMMVPIKRSQKSLSTVRAPITIVFSIRSNAELAQFCKLTPRVQDALIVSFSQSPVTLEYLFDPSKVSAKTFRLDKTAKQKDLDARLITAINRAVKSELVADILVIKGARELGGGGTASRLPFTSALGCVEVQEEEKARATDQKDK
jgi:hypothetical protein